MLLLESEADPSIRNRFGDTALHVACRLGHAELVGQLLEWNAVDATTPCNPHHMLNSTNMFERNLRDDSRRQETASGRRQIRSLTTASELSCWTAPRPKPRATPATPPETTRARPSPRDGKHQSKTRASLPHHYFAIRGKVAPLGPTGRTRTVEQDQELRDAVVEHSPGGWAEKATRFSVPRNCASLQLRWKDVIAHQKPRGRSTSPNPDQAPAAAANTKTLTEQGRSWAQA